MKKTKEQIERALDEYFPALLERLEPGGEVHAAIESGLEALEEGSLSWARLNQVMHLCSQAGMSHGFYQYYFLMAPERHPYPVELVFGGQPFEPPGGATDVRSLQQLHWGVRRFVYDAMLYWGNFRQAYRDLRELTVGELVAHFANKRVIEERLVTRGKIKEPRRIPHDTRYLISEMACKTYERGDSPADAGHVQLALEAYRGIKAEGTPATPTLLRQRSAELADKAGQRGIFDLLFEDPAGTVSSEDEVLALYRGQLDAFRLARTTAIENTRTYLSICNDLDVYVATSMRTREDFREMARVCELIFSDDRLRKYNVRYFDPTLSAAEHHEDKGIIECLMVKTAKVLLYFAQHKESLGKVSEYAMALSLGKPVIVLCPDDARGAELFGFYREQHPLLRLVEFRTGIVDGAVITQKPSEVALLLERYFSNKNEYDLAKKEGTRAYYLLRERLTQTTVRVVSDNRLLTETFWNNYHNIE